MIRRETGTSLGNSITYNPINDDKTLKNYLALAYSIVGIKTEQGRKEVSMSQACYAFGLYDNSKIKEFKSSKGSGKPRPNKGKYTKTKIVLEDTKTGEKTIYDNTYAIAERFNKSTSVISTYIKKGVRLNRRYLIYTLEKGNTKILNLNNKRVLATNINTKEKLEFESISKAAEYIGVSKGHGSYMVNEGKISKSGWKIEYIEGE